ncbi:MAG: MOSC domain-containing protein [Candidatus Omnitrophica bacterium]|nr:MOSC domain-containing protein [Candidatus Omnitrophota bacterium]
MCGKVEAVSTSVKKGEKKINHPEIFLKENWGVEGDGHAGLGIRQVSLLSMDSIAKITAKGVKVNPGDFAENITVSGIDLISLSEGTCLRLGEEVILRVTQKGKECHDKCRIYDQAGMCVMPTDGVFAVVEKGGVIRPGNNICIL